MGRVPIRNNQMASAILMSPGDPDQGPVGGKKDSQVAVCWGVEGSSEQPSELMDSMWGA